MKTLLKADVDVWMANTRVRRHASRLALFCKSDVQRRSQNVIRPLGKPFCNKFKLLLRRFNIGVDPLNEVGNIIIGHLCEFLFSVLAFNRC